MKYHLMYKYVLKTNRTTGKCIKMLQNWRKKKKKTANKYQIIVNEYFTFDDFVHRRYVLGTSENVS